MKNVFFFEKHPPLGKQLIASAAYLAGYDGNYTFSKIGSEYSTVNLDGWQQWGWKRIEFCLLLGGWGWLERRS
jgi:dolichyl-phosphate-mannose--protein O-mannosyl transferase